MGLTILNLRGGTRAPAHERAGMTLLNLSEAVAVENARIALEGQVVKKTSEALAPQLFSITTGDGEDPSFRRITSPATLRDLNPLMHERMQQVCFYLKVTTPFGKRIVEIITSYVVGEGFKPVAEDAGVQEVIDKFWADPVNRIDQQLPEWCDEQTTFGELCLPAVVNPVDGSVRLGYIDPMKIDAIEYGTLTTGDGDQEVSIPVAVRLKQMVGEDKQRRMKIIRRDEDPSSATFGKLVGDCFFFPINKAKSASRGISEIFSLADWIDVFDQMMFDFADRVRFLNAYVWHYTLNGGDDKSVSELKKKVTQNPPRQGGVMVTNEQVKIEAQTPQFHGADMSEVSSAVKKYGLGGAGLPAWFFADPMDANRSTASEMEGPTGKKLTARQNSLRWNLLEVIGFVLDKAVEHGVLKEGVDLSHTIEVPDLLIKDMQRASQTLVGISGSLSVAEDRGWVRGETAARSFHAVLTQIGVTVDTKDEYKLAQAEMQDRNARAINDLSAQSKLADALKGKALADVTDDADAMVQ